MLFAFFFFLECVCILFLLGCDRLTSSVKASNSSQISSSWNTEFSFNVYYHSAGAHNETWGILFTVEQKKEQREVPGSCGSRQIQTQQLSAVALDNSRRRFLSLAAFYYRSSKLSLWDEAEWSVLQITHANPLGLQSIAASMWMYKHGLITDTQLHMSFDRQRIFFVMACYRVFQNEKDRGGGFMW